jgi:ketol-acid reductoisomerase
MGAGRYGSGARQATRSHSYIVYHTAQSMSTLSKSLQDGQLGNKILDNQSRQPPLSNLGKLEKASGLPPVGTYERKCAEDSQATIGE